jgi:acetolactate synthase-1/3 small subunit
MEQEYTLSVFTEDKVGLLHRITVVFTKRHINLESFNASESEIKGVFRFTIVVHTTEDQIRKITRQIEKIIGVLRAFYHTNDELVYQEIALYKVRTSALAYGSDVENIIRTYHARILTVEPEYAIIEKTGHKYETQELFNKLLPFGMLQFVRSGRVAVTKQIKEITSYLMELDEANKHSANYSLNN